MRPPARCGIKGSAPAMALRVPTTFRRSTSSNSCALCATNSRGEEVPAEHTTPCSAPPHSLAAASSAPAVAAALVTSTEWQCTRCPAPAASAAACSSAAAALSTSRRRASSTTCAAPRARHSRATALPMPEEPPVTTTALPERGKVAGELNQPIRPHVTKVPRRTEMVAMRGVESCSMITQRRPARS